MRININTLEEVLKKLKCKFAEAVYSSFVQEKYSLKKCNEIDKDELKDYILIIEEKLKLLKYNFKNNEQIALRLNKTSIEYFFEKENSLTECDRKLLEKIL
jgi:hypothetical protein